MKKSILYKIGGAGVAVLVAGIVFVGCGGSDVTLSTTSTCGDWDNASSSTQTNYVKDDAATAGESASTFASQVTQVCSGASGDNLTGVLSAVSLAAASGGN
jgi:hypothetical protein